MFLLTTCFSSRAGNYAPRNYIRKQFMDCAETHSGIKARTFPSSPQFNFNFAFVLKPLQAATRDTFSTTSCSALLPHVYEIKNCLTCHGSQRRGAKCSVGCWLRTSTAFGDCHGLFAETRCRVTSWHDSVIIDFSV
jgi:hypothetical protein